MGAVLKPRHGTLNIYARRRQRLAALLGDGLLLLLASPPAVSSRDVYYHPYRADSYFYYLTGLAEPFAALLVSVENGAVAREILLCQQRDKQAEQWSGERSGPLRARRLAAIAESGDIGRLDVLLEDMAAKHDCVHWLPGADQSVDAKMMAIAAARRGQNREGTRVLRFLRDVSLPLDEMRMIKDKEEIDLLRQAAQITADGHRAAMRAAASVKTEGGIESALTAVFREAGATNAFAPIVASGRHACVLHYTANNARLRPQGLILTDAGAYMGGYCGDMTRTFPASGRFMPAQAAVYDVVLQAQKKALAAVRPGVAWDVVERAASQALAAGLIDLGLCRGSVAAVLAHQHERRFYMHRVGHLLGMDVHDVGRLTTAKGLSRRLQAGMVLTIEPGLYIADEPDIPRPLRGIGVRIEDDVLVTRRGCEILSEAPKTRADIEDWMNG